MYFSAIEYADIARRSSARGLQSEYSRRKWRISTSIRQNISQTVCNTASYY